MKDKAKPGMKKITCPMCNSHNTYMSQKKGLRCRKCGYKADMIVEIIDNEEKLKVLNRAIKKLDKVTIYYEYKDYKIIFNPMNLK